MIRFWVAPPVDACVHAFSSPAHCVYHPDSSVFERLRYVGFFLSFGPFSPEATSKSRRQTYPLFAATAVEFLTAVARGFTPEERSSFFPGGMCSFNSLPKSPPFFVPFYPLSGFLAGFNRL